MGSAVVAFFLASLLVALPASKASNPALSDDVNVIHVGGKVMCQDCTKGWNEWAHMAEPLKGCKVAVTCLDARGHAVFHGSDETDDLGAFEVLVNKKDPNTGRVLAITPDSCSVRLVSSPHPNCNVLTNFAGGRTGVPLGIPSEVYQDFVKFYTGPLFFTTPMCDDPVMPSFQLGPP